MFSLVGNKMHSIHTGLASAFLLLTLILIKVRAEVDINRLCPRMIDKVFDGYAPIGNKTAGSYQEHSATNLEDCVIDCCRRVDCNVAFIFNQTCYHVKCVSNEQCLPLKRADIRDELKMVLVNPTTPENSWLEVLKASTKLSDVSNDLFDGVMGENFYRNRLPYAKYVKNLEKQMSEDMALEEHEQRMNYGRLGVNDQYSQYDNDLFADESKIALDTDNKRCPLELEKFCPENEVCIQSDKSDLGFCKCKYGYTRNKYQKCEAIAGHMSYNPEHFTENLLQIKQLSDMREEPHTSLDEKLQKLSVSVVSKTVQLPDKKAALAAFPVPDEQTSGVAYNYTWTLISQPSGNLNGSMSDKTKSQIELSNLSEGVYRFKVVVSGKGWRGETFANVTVLPEKRISKAPEVIITPAQQIIKEPTNEAILDGSTSKANDKITSWHWDLVQGPIGYQPSLPETSTLQLTNLTLPGNYTFKLTVMDTDNKTNSTTANITVMKAIDYPPTANAGEAKKVYLPDNKITLDGSKSSDDHGIVAWEWTKDASDVSKAVDMQNTRTPYLQLSNLEEGIYTFVLKVTDASNQSNSAEVRVFVKPPSNKAPVADAGDNSTISLPQTWVLLNASKSTDDIKISSYEWFQLSGPTNATIFNRNAAVANATGLTIGMYQFQVLVGDESKNNATATTIVTVVQEQNSPPVAHAGGDQTVTLPTNSIYMDGTKSTDDLGIVKYEWTRDSTSLAIGTIVGNTDHEPVLIMTNIVPGRYVFKLTVYDSQGLSASDTVSIIVHPDPLIMNLLEVTFSVGVSVLTQIEALSLQQKLLLLLGNNFKLVVRDLKMEQKTGEAILIFYVERENGVKDNEVISGLEVERLLNDKLWRGSNIVGTPISDIRTTICQNRCSGHGVCNSETRACMCETFWMPSIYYFWGISEANCDWSILYVVIGVFVVFIFISAICWAVTCYFRRVTKPRSRSKAPKYALLESHENEIPTLNRGISLSESETDSDVLFESQTKSNGLHRTNNGTVSNGQRNYSTTRLGRKIKT